MFPLPSINLRRAERRGMLLIACCRGFASTGGAEAGARVARFSVVRKGVAGRVRSLEGASGFLGVFDQSVRVDKCCCLSVGAIIWTSDAAIPGGDKRGPVGYRAARSMAASGTKEAAGWLATAGSVLRPQRR